MMGIRHVARIFPVVGIGGDGAASYTPLVSSKLPFLTIPSISPSSHSLPSITTPSLTTPSFTPAQGGGSFKKYYTTWTWYFYSYYLTYITITTSKYITTSTTLSVYTSALSNAQSTFRRTSAATIFPPVTTAAEVTAAPAANISWLAADDRF